MKLCKRAFIRAFASDGILIDHQGGRETLHGIRDLVIADGFPSERREAEMLSRMGVETHIMGDAKSPRTLLEATAEADELARAL